MAIIDGSTCIINEVLRWITRGNPIILITMLLVTACIQKEPSPILRDEIHDRWLNGVPCKPPCWEGITPGATTVEEATLILKNSPFISQVELGQVAVLTNGGYIQWTWKKDKSKGNATFDPQTSPAIISEVNTMIPSTYRLQEVIQHYGEPSAVVAVAGHEVDIGSPIAKRLQIVFEPLGFYLTAKIVPQIIDGDTITYAPILFDSTSKRLEDVLNSPSSFISKWSGFNTFKFYCKDNEQGKACESE